MSDRRGSKRGGRHSDNGGANKEVDDEHDDDDDVESFRRRQRKADRKQRQRQVEDEDSDILEQRKNSGKKTQQDDYDDEEEQDPSKSTDFELERQKRMERLREELKKEDENMSALDKSDFSEDGIHRRSDRQELKPQETIIEVNQEDLEGLDEEDQLRRLMGIESFGSTKGAKVEDNQNSAARGVAAKNKARQYRQYMNRKNGFNRPLEKMN